MVWSVVVFFLVLAAALDILGFFLWYACSVPQSQVLGPALVRGKAVGRRVAVTFDDGPLSPYTERILDILRDRKVRATFFVCGRNAELYPDIVRRIAAEGHTLGNHTFSHPYLFFLSRSRMADEVDRTQAAIAKLTGLRPKLFRPPYGGRWFGLFPLLRERQMKMIMWSDGGEDWKNGSAATVRDTLRRLGPGSVILLHDGQQAAGGFLDGVLRGAARKLGLGLERQAPSLGPTVCTNTVEALPDIIDGARRAGLEFVPVQKFLSER